MRKLQLLLLMLFSSSIILAQERTVSGMVSDASGSPLPGVNVIVKGTSTGTVTDVNGKYIFDISESAGILVFSSVGYVTQEIAINNQSVIDMSMTEDITALGEIVVVGYGTQKKINLTGSVEQVEGATLAKQPVFQVSQALTGTVPGVTVIQNSGQPGKDIGTIRIRGLGSLGSGAKNEPLGGY